MKDEFLIERSNDFTIESVGLKAKNLLEYRLITPEFIVLSSAFFSEWRKAKNFNKRTKVTIDKIAVYFQKRDHKQIILRSSCTTEDLSSRGKYLSEVCNTSVYPIRSCLAKIFTDFQENSKRTDGLAIIIQAYRKPRIQGHLSNERRVDLSKKIWLIEKEFDNESEVQVEKITTDTTESEFDFSINRCLNSNTLNRSLIFLASWFGGQQERYHIEWLWDGTNFWIIQVDVEQHPKKVSKPGSDWIEQQKKKKTASKRTLDNLEVLETIATTKNKWPKIKSLKVFSECELPLWDIYILENSNVINQLSKGEVDISLASDLKKLLGTPIILRSDILKSKDSPQKFEVLLPRTETIFDYARAIEFLKENCKLFAKSGLKSDQYCFLIHQFIPSMSGALSYAKPNLDRVRIDATWGIVEGLYFHPHDSFELKVPDGKILKKIRRKDKYVDFDKDGSWYSKEAGDNFDWRQSLTDNQIKIIAKATQKIADHVSKPVTVMFFVNDKRYFPEILTWIYSEDEIPESDTNYTNVIFSNKRFVIKSQDDFKELKKRDVGNEKSKILLKLNTDLSRDKKLIEDIATFAKRKNYVVDIEGSILSHPYYVLYSKGVHVRCVDPLESHYNQKEFHKLVRDRIPVLIQNNKEEVLTANVSSEELLHLLKEKAVEEALELYWSKGNDSVIEEMADLLEVLIGACKAYGIEFKDIEKVAERKREKRGGFEKGVILVATKENSLFQLVTKRNSLFDERKSEIEDVKIRPVIKFFPRGEINNYKSLTEVDKVRLAYINNLASKSNSFRYLLKKDEYNSLLIEYKEKEIVITLEKADLEVDPNQIKIIFEQGINKQMKQKK